MSDTIPGSGYTQMIVEQSISNAFRTRPLNFSQIRGRCLPTAPIDGVGVHSKKTQERRTLCSASSLLATCFWPVYRFQLLPSATPPLGIVDHAHHSNIFFLFSALRRRCVSAWFLINWKRQLRTDQYARVAQSTSYDVNFGASKTSSSLADRITGTNFFFFISDTKETRGVTSKYHLKAFFLVYYPLMMFCTIFSLFELFLPNSSLIK